MDNKLKILIVGSGPSAYGFLNSINNFKKYEIKANSDYVSNIYKSYDKYINNKYEIDINEKVLERLKNSF